MFTVGPVVPELAHEGLDPVDMMHVLTEPGSPI